MKRRVSLLVEVDLAPSGHLSTVNHWRELLQQHMDDFALAFRPYVRGTVSPDADSRIGSQNLSHENGAGVH